MTAAFDLRRWKHLRNSYIRVTRQAESVMSKGGLRLCTFPVQSGLFIEQVITADGTGVSKGKSMVVVRRPGGEVVLKPFIVHQKAFDLDVLVETLREVGGRYSHRNGAL